MSATKKLQNFRAKIESSTITNDELAVLIGIELYEYIRKTPELKKEFNRRFEFLDKFKTEEEIDDETRLASASLHTKQFQIFKLNCARVRPLKELEGLYLSSGGKLRDNRSIKKSALVVIDDLIETVEKDEFSDAKNDPFLFYISRVEGLYRVKGNRREIYELDPSSERYRIVDGLKKKFQDTEEFSREIGTTPQKLRAQIAELKSKIQRTFEGIKGKDFIESKRKLGYRLGEKITLEKLK